jgi:hypothetical protein
MSTPKAQIHTLSSKTGRGVGVGSSMVHRRGPRLVKWEDEKMKNQMIRGAVALMLATGIGAVPVAAQVDPQTATAKAELPAPGATDAPAPACAPGNPIGGIIVKGAKNPTGPQKRCVPPETAKSINEKGVDTTKSR